MVFFLTKSSWLKQDPLLYLSRILRWCLERRARHKYFFFFLGPQTFPSLLHGFESVPIIWSLLLSPANNFLPCSHLFCCHWMLPWQRGSLAGAKILKKIWKASIWSLNKLSEVRKQEYLFLSAASLAQVEVVIKYNYDNDGLDWGLLDGLEIPCPSVKTHNYLRYCHFALFAVTSVPEPY